MYELLSFFEVPKSSYLNWKSNNKDKYKSEKELIAEIFNENKARYGYRRITAEMRNREVVLNHKTVLDLMNELGLHPKTKRVAKYSSYKGTVGKTAPNRLNRQFDVKEPDTVWATDVTEFKTEEGKVYLSPVKDFCSGDIVSYRRGASPNLDMVMGMMKDAITAHPCASGLMLHSDQGWQYQHSAFVNLLRDNDITQSMSRKGNCIDNCKMESFFGTMKNEMYYGHEKEFKTRQQLYDAIDEYIKYYNEKRIQLKLNCLSPLNFRKQAA